MAITQEGIDTIIDAAQTLKDLCDPLDTDDIQAVSPQLDPDLASLSGAGTDTPKGGGTPYILIVKPKKV